MAKLCVKEIEGVGVASKVTLSSESVRGTTVWRVNGHAETPFDGGKGIRVLPKQPSVDSFVAIENHSPFWCRPFFGTDLGKLPALVQGLLIRSKNVYRYVLPVCDHVWKTVLHGGPNGMEFRIYTNCEGICDCDNQLAWVEAEGKDPRALLRLCAEVAAKELGNGLKMREERAYPEALEWLGWCSWDALQIRVSESGLLEKAKEFKEKKVPIGFGIIDDMWADVPNLLTVPADITFDQMVEIMHGSPMRAFDGDPVRFPNGMETAIRKLKEAGIPRVGIWFPTTGYWFGFIPNEKGAEELGEHLGFVPNGRLIVKPEEKDTIPYFDKLCEKAAAWGGDFVKIDNQGCHLFYQNVAPIGSSAKSLQAGIEKAVEKHFGGALINCMGMPSECMFHRPDSAISRCSDDFIPESRSWFTKNILQCAYNGMLQGQYYVNDWDMWWTDDGQAAKNGLCRAISGGPIYISDKIGRTRPEILKPVCLSNGRLLRCDASAMPTADCMTDDPTKCKRPLKIFNRVGEKFLLAAFNIDENEDCVAGSFCPRDIGIRTEQCVIYDYFEGVATLVKSRDSLPFTLENADCYKLFWLIPYEGVPVMIGRPDLFVGCKAIEEKNGSYRPMEACEVLAFSERSISVSGKTLEKPQNGLYRFFADGEFTVQ